MKTKFKITIPEPCHEDWNKMTPDEMGRFCSSCVKNVVDFTNMKDAEIQAYFSKNKRQKVCGRFKNEQLNKVEIQIPQSILQQKRPFRQTFLLILFVVMGSTLFSCKNHNDDYVTGEPTVVEDTIPERNSTMGLMLPEKDTLNKEEILVGKIDVRRYDSLVKAGVKMPPLPPPPPKAEEEKFKK